MVQLAMLRVKSLLAILLFATLISGCANLGSPPPDSPDPSASDQTAPSNPGAPTTPLVKQASNPDPDPLLSDEKEDPLTASGSKGDDPLSANDPLTRAAGGSSTSDVNTRPINNWYWLRGSISHGSVDVKVNGREVGRYSVRVDTEISDYLNAGPNEIDFTTDPSETSDPVTCDLTVVYSQQLDGAPPVAEFNSETDVPDQPTSQPIVLAHKHKPGDIAQPAPSFDAMNPTGGITKTLTFIAQ